jgi:hypothetical protein
MADPTQRDHAAAERATSAAVPSASPIASTSVELDPTRSVRQDRLMEGFHEGQKVWVEQPDGSQRPGVFVTDAEIPGLLGGPPAAYVVYPDTRSGEEVSLLRVTPREE